MKKKTIGIIAFAEKNGGGVTEFVRSIIENIPIVEEYNYIIYAKEINLFNVDDRIRTIKVLPRKSSISKKFFRGLSFLIPFIPSRFLLSNQELEIFNESDFFYCPYISPYPHYFLKKPYFFTLHDLQEHYLYKFFKLKEHIIRRVLNRALLKNSVFVTCESKFVKKDIIKIFKINENLIELFQAPPSNSFLEFSFEAKKSNEIKLKYGLPEKYFFYPAQFWKHKNHIRLVKAFQKLSLQIPEIKLVFTGSEKNALFNLRFEIEKMKISERILFLGYIDKKDMPYVYKNSLSLVMPSLFESISIPVFESLSLGVPVISSNVFGLKEQVSEFGILFDPLNTDSIFQSLSMAINNQELLRHKALMGREHIKRVNSNFKNDLNLLFRRLINENKLLLSKTDKIFKKKM